MKKWMKRIFCLGCVILAGSSLNVYAAGAAGIGNVVQMESGLDEEKIAYYEEGEVVGFIGDSITHVEYTPINYVEFLYNFYLSRFPNQKVEFRNLGVSSYKVSDILALYDKDPAFQGLDKAVIMLGMNEAYKKVPTETYISNMEQLIGRLKQDGLAGEDILVLAPTPYDETCKANFNAAGNPILKLDGSLTDYTNALAEKSKEWGVNYVDLHTPMLEWTHKIQEADPNNTLTIWDCMHPSAVGEMLMAYYVLKAQGADPYVSQIIVPQEGEVKTKNASVTDFYRGEKGLRWAFKPETLPMATTEDYWNFEAELFSLTEELNQEILQIEGLQEDVTYVVAMDGVELDSFTGAELAEGVNLATLENNPLQMVMQEVETLDEQWHVNSAAYRTIILYATMPTPTHTMDQMQEAYESWTETDPALRDEMYGQVQEAVAKSYVMTVTEEGYSVDAMEEEFEREAKNALNEKEQEGNQSEEGRSDQELAKRETATTLIVVGIAAVIVGLGLVCFGLWVILNKKRHRK